MQFSLRCLLALIAFACVASYTLIFPSPIWVTAWFTFSIGALLGAVTLIPVAPASARAFWIGFAIFGWGYWAVLHSPLLDFKPGAEPSDVNWRLHAEGPPLPSSKFLQWAYFSVLPRIHTEPKFDAAGNLLNTSSYPDELTFMRVGHSIFDIVCAVFGGVFASFAFRRLSDRPQRPDRVH